MFGDEVHNFFCTIFIVSYVDFNEKVFLAIDMWDISHYNKIIKELKECVMKNFDVIAYTKLDGTVPVNEFLYTLSEKNAG